MSVANLTKYACFGDGDMTAVNDKAVGKMEVYVKFEEAMEASSNSIQQLKAEIAAQCDILDSYTFDINLRAVSDAVDKLRQLSAV